MICNYKLIQCHFALAHSWTNPYTQPLMAMLCQHKTGKKNRVRCVLNLVPLIHQSNTLFIIGYALCFFELSLSPDNIHVLALCWPNVDVILAQHWLPYLIQPHFDNWPIFGPTLTPNLYISLFGQRLNTC